MCAQAAARAAVNIGAGAAPRRGPSKCIWLVGRMRRSGWEAPTYPSFDFRPSAEKSLVLSLKRASARTPRARRSGTGPGRWVDLASLKASRPRMYALGRAERSRSRHFTAKRWPKTKLALHTSSSVKFQISTMDRFHPRTHKKMRKRSGIGGPTGKPRSPSSSPHDFHKKICS